MKLFVTAILLISLSFSLFGCSPRNPSSVMTEPSVPMPEPSTSDITNPGRTDPNGFNSLEELIDVHIALNYTGTATEVQMRKIYPEHYWQEMADFDALYAKWPQRAQELQENMIKQFGIDFEVSYSIVETKMTHDYSQEQFTEEDIQEHIKLFGAPPSMRSQWEIVIALTIRGSTHEKTVQRLIHCIKVGDIWYGY